MPSDREKQQKRREALLEIIGGDVPVGNQRDLALMLEERGIRATQSSVSRDMQDLGIHRVDGYYQLGAWGMGETKELRRSAAFMRKAESAGPNLLLIFTDEGSAEMVATAIRSAEWPEVVGSVAWNDTIFLATHNAQEQKRLFRRFETMLATADPNVL